MLAEIGQGSIDELEIVDHQLLAVVDPGEQVDETDDVLPQTAAIFYAAL